MMLGKPLFLISLTLFLNLLLLLLLIISVLCALQKTYDRLCCVAQNVWLKKQNEWSLVEVHGLSPPQSHV